MTEDLTEYVTRAINAECKRIDHAYREHLMELFREQWHQEWIHKAKGEL